MKQRVKPRITVYSDYICPFCFIGKDRVDRLEKEFDLDIEWKGFEIHPETPREGGTLKDMGLDESYVEMAKASVTRLADDAGLDINFPPKISNSRLALEISEFARDKGRFREFHDAVFRAYWQEGKDIGDREFLFEVAERAGLDVEELKGYLEAGKGRERLGEYLREVRGLGITGVPTFIIGDRMIVGAQPYDVLKKVVEEEGAEGW